MSNQSKAMQLADELDAYHTRSCHKEAAAELRRLHALLEAEQALLQRVIYPELQQLRAQRDALLEFARYVADLDPGNPAPLFVNARAAIKAVEGEKT